MREIAARLRAWHESGTGYAVATVVAVGGSAPRLPGAAMAVSADGEAVGSVSGGCVEGAVYELCREALRTGEAARESFGYSDSDAFAVGLTCGGTIEVVVRPGPVPDAGLAAVSRDEHVAFAHVLPPGDGLLVVRPDRHEGTTGRADVDSVVIGETRAMLDAGRTGSISVRCEDDLDVFVQSFAPAPRLLVFGAIDHAAAVARIGAFLGYRVTVCDARPVFATPARFPGADEVVVDWPHRYLDNEAERGAVDGRTVVCVLTHDAKFDVPLLEVALRLPVAYVGAMGSRRTHHDRLARLRAAGLADRELARLRSPIGLDLGARTPEETAVAIAAEFVAARRGGTALPLGQTHGPIHHDHQAVVA
ncbi:XdhC family protein [Actinomadura macrotermitis]|uniref:Putative xanthine dehydrogenase subunit A n=1 Tax=Actinomadura macrotermitis TaxID=2585200 RepID=A0A7K0BQ94_9ACTN|nr:XdhC family protein [Actinomadura macrotermitis]MQY03307.1 putative xanthine dehydrogenase subunit A [Actinomadura macrotermitis]